MTGKLFTRLGEHPLVVRAFVAQASRGDFYILCPDGETTRAIDEKRIQWTAGDMIENRPALSRWHPAHRDAFAAYMDAD